MYIRYFSDIHLELLNSKDLKSIIKKIKIDSGQVCVIPGDIGNPYSSNYKTFMDFINNNFKKTFIICGNHEYYNNGKTIEETNDFLNIFFNQYNNISYLNNDVEIYNNYCFIGTTLWSRVNEPRYAINDIKYIKGLTCDKYNNLHDVCFKFLNKVISNSVHKNIILTHHLPSFKLIDKKYKIGMNVMYNQWFASNLDIFMTNNSKKIKMWFYGHTHTPHNTTMYNITFACNPIGYVNENKIIDFNKTINIKD